MANNTAKQLRIPPQSIDSEQALLGSILLRSDVLYDVLDNINMESFYSEKHRIIFESMTDLFKKNSPVDVLSLSTKLKEKKELDQVGGSAYLTELVNMVPSAANAKHYAETVHRKSMMRKLIAASDYISELGFTESEELDSLLDKAEKTVFEITEKSAVHKFISIEDTLKDAWERFEELSKTEGKLRGITTGFTGLDGKLAGLQKSDLIILAARPSMGKTSLALDIARQAACVANVPVGIFSLEMSSQQLVDRMVAADSRVDGWKLRTGNLKDDSEFQMLSESLDRLRKAPIYIDDQPGNNILKMRSVARRLKREKGLELIIVDYLQLMVPTQSKASDSTVQQVTEISRSLKQLARELEVPVVALSQLSRAVEQRRGRPRLSDLRDSGSIEQDADVVMFIHREDKMSDDMEKNNIAEIIIEKHRNGPTGSTELYFDENRASFMNLDRANHSNDLSDF